MAALKWDKAGEKKYELGIDRGVLYVQNSNGTYQTGVAWNGIISIKESRKGGEQNVQYADNKKYLCITAKEKFNGTIEAFNYPNEFTYCDGKRQPIPGLIIASQRRSRFGFCYRTKRGNDMLGSNRGYKLHILYNVHAKPSEEGHKTKSDSQEPMKYSWEFTTDEVYCSIEDVKIAFAHIEIDSTKVNKENLGALEANLYGTDNTDPLLPSPEEVYAFLSDEGPWAADEENGVLYIWQSLSSSDLPNGELYIE